MTFIFDFINQYLFSPVLRFFTGISGGSFAAGIFLFTLAINIVLIPLSVKSQKASVQQIKIKPKLDELKKKCGDDKQKYQMGMQKIYQEENVSMGGGCLPMIIRLVLIMSIYYLVVSPITYLAPNVDKDTLNAAITAVGEEKNLRSELVVIEKALDGSSNDENVLKIKDEIEDLKFDLFGAIDLTKQPKFSLNFSNVTKEQLLLWVIPFASFVAAMFSSVISLVQQKRVNPSAPNMAGMMLTMPLMSLFIAFNAPAGLGLYWAFSSIIGGLIQAGVQEFYGPYKMIAKEQKKQVLASYEKGNKG